MQWPAGATAGKIDHNKDISENPEQGLTRFSEVPSQE